MEKKLELFEAFNDTIKKAQKVQREWQRLEHIEERVQQALDKAREEREGLWKGENIASINPEARGVICLQRKAKEREINRLCDFLGLKKEYEERG